MRRWMVTFFGLGYVPVAPGTFGSIGASAMLWVVFWALRRAMTPESLAIAWPVVVAGLLILFSVMAISLGRWAVGHFGRNDPQPFVLDEVAGICLSNLFLPIYSGPRQFWPILLALAAFRLFDVTKPPPARQLEKLPLGWGILFDDLAAAVYANVLCQVLLRLVLS